MTTTDLSLLAIMRQLSRPPNDVVEQELVNCFSALPSVEAIWARREPLNRMAAILSPTGPAAERMTTRAAQDVQKTQLRQVWLQLRAGGKTPGFVREVQARRQELEIRATNQAWTFEIHLLVDALPAQGLVPSCIWLRHPLLDAGAGVR